MGLHDPRGGRQIRPCIYSVFICVLIDSYAVMHEVVPIFTIMFRVFYAIDYAYTLICCFVYCHCRSLSYECICKHSMCTCATIVATCAQLIIRVLCELPTYTQCTLITSLCHHSLKSPQLLRLSCAISGYSSVGRASDCRPLQQSNGP